MTNLIVRKARLASLKNGEYYLFCKSVLKQADELVKDKQKGWLLMRKRLSVAVFVLAIVSILNTPICAKPCDEVRLGQNEAQHDYTVEPVLNQIRCTCYIQKGTTASGQKVRKGIVAGRREWIGRTCALYSVSENGGGW
jgi:hypothetical protein